MLADIGRTMRAKEGAAPRRRGRGRRLVLHPILFALYPVLFLWASNVDHIRAADVVRPLLIALLLGVLALLLARWLVGEWARAGLLASLGLVWFFSYGHVHRLLDGRAIAGLSVGRHRYLLIAFGLGLVTVGWWLWKRAREPEKLNAVFHLVAATAVAFPLLTLAAHAVAGGSTTGSTTRASGLAGPSGASPAAGTSAAGRLPDVYYIVLDAYARQDVLEKVYEYDNSPFLDALTERGFYVAARSTSNYNQTILSLASALNLDYLEAIAGPLDPQEKNPHTVAGHIRDSRVRRILEELGYATVAFRTGYPGTEIEHAAHYYGPAPDPRPGVPATLSRLGRIGELDALLVETSMAVALADYASRCATQAAALDPPEAASADRLGGPCRLFEPLTAALRYPFLEHRERILFILDSLPALPAAGGPRFVFAHILAPHFPFVFGRGGEVRRGPGGTRLFRFEGTREQYLAGYVDQLTYINERMLEVVDGILATSETEPIIILQADHGPGANWFFGKAAGVSAVVERLAILNAYYLPQRCSEARLYDTVSPVNSFRLVLNACFGGEHDLLEDRRYWARYETPFALSDRTSAFER